MFIRKFGDLTPGTLFVTKRGKKFVKSNGIIGFNAIELQTGNDKSFDESIEVYVSLEYAKRYKHTPDPLLQWEDYEIMIFGANQLGQHLGGAARFATEKRGAVMGEIHRTGNTYGLVTVNFPVGDAPPSRLTVEELEEEFALCMQAVTVEQNKIFYLTKVGLGIGGWELEDVKACFKKTYVPSLQPNLIYPIEFE